MHRKISQDFQLFEVGKSGFYREHHIAFNFQLRGPQILLVIPDKQKTDPIRKFLFSVKDFSLFYNKGRR